MRADTATQRAVLSDLAMQHGQSGSLSIYPPVPPPNDVAATHDLRATTRGTHEPALIRVTASNAQSNEYVQTGRRGNMHRPYVMIL